MKNHFTLCQSIVFSVLLICSAARAEEAHTQAIITRIMNTRQAILAKAGSSSADKYLFLAFWDFDGTILKGDCSEGLKLQGKSAYKGLAELAIESGYSRIYAPEGGFDRFWKDYRHFEEGIGRWLAYPFIPQMLRGARTSDISALAEEQFATVLQDYYFQSSIDMLHALESKGINNYIISASADIFVDAAATTLGLPKERFHGIEVQVEEGRLTEKLIYPITWAKGKIEKLTNIVATLHSTHPDKNIIILAAFGNSYSTDAPFLEYVAKQSLPAGKPVAVMINGGEAPAAYKDVFLRVQQTETIEISKSQ